MRHWIAGLAVVVALVGIGQVEAGLVAHWNLDGNGLDSADSHDGTVYGASGTQDRFGNANSAMLFDGSDDYIDVAHHADLTPSNAMTISAWFKPNSFNLGSYSWPAIVKKYNDVEDSGYAMEIVQVWEGTPKAGFSVATSAGPVAPDIFPVGTDTWYFYAGVYEYDSGTDQSTFTTFFGPDFQSLQSASAIFDGPLHHSTENLNIGRDNWITTSNRHFNGVIDDVRIYDEALTAQQVGALYAVPEFSSLIVWSLIALGFAGIGWCRRRNAG